MQNFHSKNNWAVTCGRVARCLKWLVAKIAMAVGQIRLIKKMLENSQISANCVR